ncbi:dihydrofolate reductase family protein [Streptomyces sp. NPDC046805]|uniref:dihydrofolate reductase family protein n=1 Tax=Streptomyces sp. NPDC046805 TaxID=3155134 RepID=UPI0033FFA2F1
MGKLVSTIFVTLDGVYQAPGGPQEDTRGDFTQGGWSFTYGDEEFGRFVSEVFDRAGAFLLGRRTYDIFAGYWPKMTDPADPIASRLNTLPKYVASKYVASSTLQAPEWPGTIVVGGSGDLAKEVTALKERTDGELQVHGSGALVRSLLGLGVVDTLHLLTFPVVLGTGLRLFEESITPTAFRHTGGHVTRAGVSIQSYDIVGRPEFGSYEFPENA